MSDMDGLDLFDLFKGEIETHGAALDRGLLALEADLSSLEPIAALMRAAHSIKGAARVVGVDAIVGLAHQMEDALVRIQKGAEPCTAARVDQLLQATALISRLPGIAERELPEWSGRSATDINALVTALSAPADAGTAESAGSGATPRGAGIAPTRREPEPAEGARSDAGETPQAMVRVPASIGVHPVALGGDEPARVRAAEPPSPDSRTVRVHADNLDRMMRLAGESMVEGRRLPQVQGGVRELKSRLRATRAALADAEASPAVVEARRELAAMERTLARHQGMLEATFRRTEEVGTSLYQEAIASRMRPFGDACAGFPRMVRDIARMLGKQVRFEIAGDSTAVDRDVLARLDAPLNHLLRNALDHGIETPDRRSSAGKPAVATLRLEARHHAGMLEVRVIEDGAGIDSERVRARVVERGLQSSEVARDLTQPELLEFLFLPGFSTAGTVTEVSGRGVGLDVVHQTVRDLGGRVRIETRPGAGTSFVLSLPITLSVIRAAIVRVAGESLAFPLARIERIERIDHEALVRTEGRLRFDLDGEAVGVLPAGELLRLDGVPTGRDAVASLLVLGTGADRCALLVDGFQGERDLVVRPLDERLGRVPGVAAAAIDDDGTPVLVMDVEDLLVSIRRGLAEGAVRGLTPQALAAGTRGRRRVLVADDSITVREVERQMLRRLGHDVEVAVDGLDAWNRLCAERFDLLVTDVDMPRMNGIELVRTLRRDPRFAHLPVAIVSYKDRPEDRAAGLDAGANAYLTKGSFQDQTFARTIEDLIGEAVP